MAEGGYGLRGNNMERELLATATEAATAAATAAIFAPLPALNHTVGSHGHALTSCKAKACRLCLKGETNRKNLKGEITIIEKCQGFA